MSNSRNTGAEGKAPQPGLVSRLRALLHLNISTRLIAGFGIIAAISASVGAVGLYFLEEIDTNLNRITDVTAPTVETADDLIANIWQATKIAEEIMASEILGEIMPLMGEFADLGTSFTNTYDEIMTLAHDDPLLAELETVAARHADFTKLAEGMFSARMNELSEERETANQLTKFDATGARLISMLDRLTTLNKTSMLGRNESAHSLPLSKAEFRTLTNTYKQRSAQIQPVVEISLKLQRLIIELQDTAAEYVAETEANNLTRALDEFSSLKNRALSHLQALMISLTSQQGPRELDGLRSSFIDWTGLATGESGLFATHRKMLKAKREADRLENELDIEADSISASLNQIADFADTINDGADEEAAKVVALARTIVAGLLAFAILMSALLIFLVINTVTRPIQIMTQTVADFGKRDADVVIPLDGRNDEIGKLAATFNVMMQALNKATKNLEKQVHDRTVELKQTNTQLESELALRKSLEDQLVQVQKLDSLGTLAGGVAHDFNNMLFVIIGSVDLALKQLSESDPIRKELTRINEAARQSKAIVQQILYFSRQEKPVLNALPVAKIVQGAVTLIRAGLPSSCILDVKVDNNCGQILADETQIHQLIVNLATNAFHAYEGQQGTVELTVKKITVSKDYARQNVGLKVGQYIQLSVTDHGCGISDAEQQKVFDPFFTTKPVGEGTGLGLSVAHGIVAEHDGTIQLTSKLGVGTTFDVFLPEHQD